MTTADPLHTRATIVVQHFQTRGAHLIIAPTTITELYLVGLKILGLNRMKQAMMDLRTQALIEAILQADVNTAIALFQRQQSKNELLCDCFVMTLAKRIGVDCIFSFEQGYTKNGFLLAEQFFATQGK